MKIVVVGGSGVIGSRLWRRLCGRVHEVFFSKAGQQLMAAEIAAGVRRHLEDRLVRGDFFRAKFDQENVVRASGLPYTIVSSTQLIHFSGAIADDGTASDAIDLPVALMPPVDARFFGGELAIRTPSAGDDAHHCSITVDQWSSEKCDDLAISGGLRDV